MIFGTAWQRHSHHGAVLKISTGTSTVDVFAISVTPVVLAILAILAIFSVPVIRTMRGIKVSHAPIVIDNVTPHHQNRCLWSNGISIHSFRHASNSWAGFHVCTRAPKPTNERIKRTQNPPQNSQKTTRDSKK
jgi:hypothetical protein